MRKKRDDKDETAEAEEQHQQTGYGGQAIKTFLKRHAARFHVAIILQEREGVLYPRWNDAVLNFERQRTSE